MASPHSRARGSFLAGVLLLGFAASTGCNAVLGIEQAQLDPNASTDPNATCNWPEHNPETDCTSCDEGCVKQCNIGDCLGDASCRSGLFDYLRCVGTGCVDSTGECTGCIQASSKAVAAARCLQHCGGGCDIAGSISLCQGYCACMHQQCSDNEPNAGGQGGCMRACMNGLPAGTPLGIPDSEARDVWTKAPEPWQIGCFWYHCEAADMPNDGFHCDHAIGQHAASMCPKPLPEDPNAVLCQYPKRYGNAPCNVDAECCSHSCLDSGVCSAPGR